MFSAYLRLVELLSLQVTDVLVLIPGSPFYAAHLRRAGRGQPSEVGLCDETLLLGSSAPPLRGHLLVARRVAAAGPALFDFDCRSLSENFKGAGKNCVPSARRPDLTSISSGRAKDSGRWGGDRSALRCEAHGALQLQEKLVSEETRSRALHCLQDVEARLPSDTPQSTRAALSSKGLLALRL
ncbi:unnamed protein product [Prorocentrum cordatum]|uniref:Uncharacterized protein n=1 Tax=Prorocentrum cordatum TaxID=2364126 RepID=A0ABN9R738_9DINO|nr:unnamed protein product [Polarella glacialis]